MVGNSDHGLNNGHNLVCYLNGDLKSRHWTSESLQFNFFRDLNAHYSDSHCIFFCRAVYANKANEAACTVVPHTITTGK